MKNQTALSIGSTTAFVIATKKGAPVKYITQAAAIKK
jgi:hypothetical protein